jgi:hypothetical protein
MNVQGFRSVRARHPGEGTASRTMPIEKGSNGVAGAVRDGDTWQGADIALVLSEHDYGP